MADYKLIGHNYQTPDMVAKVTGRAKYAEDFRADGMLFCKLLLSPMPHARVTRIDASEALRMPGVHAILTEDDLPSPAGASLGENVTAAASGIKPEMVLSNEPRYQGEPILAVAADDELTAAEAIEKIVVDLEPLPFAVDPIETLRPGSPNARTEGNVWTSPTTIETIKFTEAEWREVEAGRLPFRDAPDTWSVGDVEAGFKEAALIIDETLVYQSNSTEPLETRSAMAYWQNGKLYLHTSTQSITTVVPTMARFIGGVDPSNIVLISEYCGGGFGSKFSGTPPAAIPALLAKKTGRPVMMRISREEEHYIGRGRAGLHMRAKIGFRKDGRITAIDLFTIMDNGPYARQGDHNACARCVTLLYTPPNFRFRGMATLTNTPQRLSQRGPGGVQASVLTEPLISKAARQLGIDEVEIRKINAAETGNEFGPPNAQGTRQRLTSAFVREALDKGANLFNWEERKRRSGQRQGSKVIGVGVAVGNYSGGGIEYDGLLTIRPDGKVYIQSGCGNLGTLSVFDATRIVPEVLAIPWERCEVVWGNTAKHLPWSVIQGGSLTIHTETRAYHAAAMDARRKLQEITAKDLGGRPEDYELGSARVFSKGNPSRGLTFAQVAQRAIELGAKYDGHELPENLNPFTKASATALAGLGLMGVAKDTYGRKGATHSFVIGFAEVEVDVETGACKILDFLAVGDVGTVIHPHGLEGQLHGGAVQGFGQVLTNKWVFDQHYGMPLGKRFYHTKPPTILDIPLEIRWDAVNIPDPQTPVGAKGVGEAAECGGAAALRCALAAAIGDDYLRRTPITLDMVLSSLEAGRRVDAGLVTHV